MDWKSSSRTPVRRGDRWPVSYSPNSLVLTATWAITCNLSNETLEFVWRSVGAKMGSDRNEKCNSIRPQQQGLCLRRQNQDQGPNPQRGSNFTLQTGQIYIWELNHGFSWQAWTKTNFIWITNVTYHLHNKKNRVSYISFPQVFIILCVVF